MLLFLIQVPVVVGTRFRKVLGELLSWLLKFGFVGLTLIERRENDSVRCHS